MSEIERADFADAKLVALKTKQIVEAALERGAQEPIVLDIRELTSFADAFVLLTGRSDRQVRAIAEEVAETLRRAGDDPLGIEGMNDGRWVLIDANDIVVHIFEPELRDVYALERLWSDAPSVDLRRLGVPEAALEAAKGDAARTADPRPPIEQPA